MATSSKENYNSRCETKVLYSLQKERGLRKQQARESHPRCLSISAERRAHSSNNTKKSSSRLLLDFCLEVFVGKKRRFVKKKKHKNGERKTMPENYDQQKSKYKTTAVAHNLAAYTQMKPRVFLFFFFFFLLTVNLHRTHFRGQSSKRKDKRTRT